MKPIAAAGVTAAIVLAAMTAQVPARARSAIRCRSTATIPPIFNDAAGRSLSTFVIFAYALASGRAPHSATLRCRANLVAAALKEVAKIPGHVAVPTLSNCDRAPV